MVINLGKRGTENGKRKTENNWFGTDFLYKKKSTLVVRGSSWLLFTCVSKKNK